MKRKKRKKTHAIGAIACSECVISGKVKDMKYVRRLKDEPREVKVAINECVSDANANANARRGTNENAEGKCEEEESSNGDNAMYFGWAKVANKPSEAKMCTESVTVLRKTAVSKISCGESVKVVKKVQQCVKV